MRAWDRADKNEISVFVFSVATDDLPHDRLLHRPRTCSHHNKQPLAVRFGALYETQVGHLPESGKCQEATYAMQQTSLLLDHLVGAGEQRLRHVEADRGAACLNAV